MLTKPELQAIRSSIRERRYPSFALLEKLTDMAATLQERTEGNTGSKAPSNAFDGGKPYAEELKERLGLGQHRTNHPTKPAVPMTSQEACDLPEMTGGPKGFLRRACQLHLANGCIEFGSKEALSLGLPPSTYALEDWPSLDVSYRVFERSDCTMLVVFSTGVGSWPTLPSAWSESKPVIEKLRA